MKRSLLAGLAAVAAITGAFVSSASAQTFLPAPVVTFQPPVGVPVAPPVVVQRPATVYSPAPVVVQRPPIVSSPVVVQRPGTVTTFSGPVIPTIQPPVVVQSPVVTTLPPPVWVGPAQPVTVRSQVYVPGQPVRNVLRAITP
jgi:hypothetical protein